MISATVGMGWSLDRLRPGYYDRVPIKSILHWNPSFAHFLAGWSEDLCGYDIGYAPGSKDAVHR